MFVKVGCSFGFESFVLNNLSILHSIRMCVSQDKVVKSIFTCLLRWPGDQIVMIFWFRPRLVTRWTTWPSTKRLWSKVHWSIVRPGGVFQPSGYPNMVILWGVTTSNAWTFGSCFGEWVMRDDDGSWVKAESWAHVFFAALHEMLVASESWKAMDGCLRSMVIPHD